LDLKYTFLKMAALIVFFCKFWKEWNFEE